MDTITNVFNPLKMAHAAVGISRGDSMTTIRETTEKKLKRAILNCGLEDYRIEYRSDLSNWLLISLDGGGICLGGDEQSALISILAIKAEIDRTVGAGPVTGPVTI